MKNLSDFTKLLVILALVLSVIPGNTISAAAPDKNVVALEIKKV
ncbi:MAG TPA: hypothetical protein PK566_02150 [Pseudobacteroides sp.]|nr:hypothetical protein [Pseudobacteroides sp.]